MELKYNLMEGNDAVSRAILMMKYDLTKTFTENIISEQYNVLTRGHTITLEQVNPLEVVGKVIGAPLLLTDYMIRHYMSQFYNWLKTFDAHDWMMVIEMSSMIAASVSGPFAPIFLGIGGAAAAYDAYLYFTVDNDPYMGTIMLALSLIPGGWAKTIFKGSKVFRKRGVEGLKNLIKKSKSGTKMTKEQLKDLATFGIEFAKKSSEVKDAMVKQLSNSFAKKSLKFLAKFLLGLGKLGFNLSKIIFNVGGTIYTFDQIYLYVFRDSVFKNKKYLDSRTTNSTRKRIKALIDKLLEHDNEVIKSVTENAGKALNYVIKNGVKYTNIDVSEDAGDYLDRIIDEERKKSETKPSPTTVAPTLNDVLSGKKVIKKGQKGESVKEIQKMLHSMGYDDFVSQENKSNKSVNGNYDDSTELSVIAFQSFEGLKTSGVVNTETLTKIMKQYKKQ
jgi:hypothetical protein